MKQFYKKFTNKDEMLQSLLNLTDKLDKDLTLQINKKAFRGRFYLVNTDKKTFHCENFKKFLYMFNHITKIGIYHFTSFCNGHEFNVCTKEDIFNTTPIKTETKEETKVDITIYEAKPDVDFSKYEKLYDEKDKKGSKNLLEKAAIDDFGINLNKRASFADMILELKDAIKS